MIRLNMLACRKMIIINVNEDVVALWEKWFTTRSLSGCTMIRWGIGGMIQFPSLLLT